jgi:ABC-type uncharacterized transport system involved in gliding motility auxiliary subunit
MPRSDTQTQRRLISGSLLGAGVILAFILFVIVNYFGWKYYTRLDWTSASMYSISEKTEGILSQLDRDVEVLVFLSPGEQLYGPLMELLSSYEGASARLSVRSIDPEKNLLEAQTLVDKYQIAQLNVVIFDTGDDRRIVDTADLADYDYSGMQYGEGPKMIGFKGEQVFSSTLLELMESRKPKILFTSGHGEMSLDDMSGRGLALARDLMGQDNFELEEWITLGESVVPEATDLIVIAGPTSNFIEPELELLSRYMDEGGRLMVLLDPTLAADGGFIQTGLEPFLLDFGVQVADDIVVDPANPLPFYGPETIFVSIYGGHVITRALDQAQLPVIIPLGRSVRAAETTVDGLRVTELILTSVDGWGETDLVHLDQVAKQEADTPGPVSLAVAVEAEEAVGAEPLADQEPAPVDDLRMVVIGDSDFASNSQMQNVPNATFLANTLNWLVDRETLVGIPPKAPEQVRLSLTRGELIKISWLVLAVLPGLAVLLGIVVHLKRRR